MIDAKNRQVEAYLDNLDRLQDRFLAIREIILITAPQLDENIKWKDCWTYSQSKKNLIQTVLGKDKISLIIQNGAALENIDGWLEGDDQRTRTVRVLSDDLMTRHSPKSWQPT